jgi:HlyD family secretion protein
MKKTVKLILLITIAVIAVGSVIYYASMPMAVGTTVINPKTAELSFTEQGIVLSQRQLEVYATVSGRITLLNVTEGQYINQGDILCKIENSQGEADLERAKEKVETTKALYNSGFLSRQDLIDAENIVSDIERALLDATIKAPVSGLISQLNIKDTNVVNTLIPIALITVERDCVVEVYVSVKDIDTVEIGKKVLVILEGRISNREITATVTAIENRAEVKISALGIEERKVKVTVSPVISNELNEGYNVDVKFHYYFEENKFAVPKTALFKENGVDMVWIVQNGKAIKMPIQKGIELRTEFVIDHGLSEGVIVITDCNLSGLKEGIKVRRV